MNADITNVMEYLNSTHTKEDLQQLRSDIATALSDPKKRQQFIQDFNSFKKRFEIYKNPRKALKNDKQALLFVECANISIPSAILTSIIKGGVVMTKTIAGAEIIFGVIVQSGIIAYDVFNIIQMKCRGIIDGKECAKQIIRKLQSHLVVIGVIIASSILLSLLIATLVSPLALILIKIVANLAVGTITTIAMTKLENWLEKKITFEHFNKTLIMYSNSEL